MRSHNTRQDERPSWHVFKLCKAYVLHLRQEHEVFGLMLWMTFKLKPSYYAGGSCAEVAGVRIHFIDDINSWNLKHASSCHESHPIVKCRDSIMPANHSSLCVGKQVDYNENISVEAWSMHLRVMQVIPAWRVKDSIMPANHSSLCVGKQVDYNENISVEAWSMHLRVMQVIPAWRVKDSIMPANHSSVKSKRFNHACKLFQLMCLASRLISTKTFQLKLDTCIFTFDARRCKWSHMKHGPSCPGRHLI